jgi:hypothetical protein
MDAEEKGSTPYETYSCTLHMSFVSDYHRVRFGRVEAITTNLWAMIKVKHCSINIRHDINGTQSEQLMTKRHFFLTSMASIFDFVCVRAERGVAFNLPFFLSFLSFITNYTGSSLGAWRP